MNDPKYSAASTGPEIERFLKPVLQHASLRLSYDVGDGNPADDAVETPDVVVRFHGPDTDLLLENRAELLLALEHLTMEALRVSSEDHSRICFDCNDYRLLRIEELRLSANAAADKVKRTGMPFKFNPMNSRERRIIHLALRNESEVRSESMGTGGYRQVVVYPAGMPSLPEQPPPERRSERGSRGRGPAPPRSRSARR